MTWGVYDIYTMIKPVTGGCGGGDSDAAFLLLLHPVHSSGAIMDFADAVTAARIIKDTFCGGGLAGIDVCHDADISISFEGSTTSHRQKFL